MSSQITELGERFKRWMTKRSFKAEFFRNNLTGIWLAVTMLDAVTLSVVEDSIKFGQLPSFSIDVGIILCMGLMEAVACALWACLTRRLRSVLMMCTMTLALAAFLLLATPDIPTGDGTEFCTSSNSSLSYEGVPPNAWGRLILILVVTVLAVISRAALWSLSIPVLEYGNPKEITLQYGLLLCVRIIGMRLAPSVLTPEQAMWFKIMGIAPPLVIHALQFLKFEDPTPKQYKQTSMPSSIGRILSSWQTTGQILSISLVSTALWGFSWHESEIKKLITPDDRVRDESLSAVHETSRILEKGPRTGPKRSPGVPGFKNNVLYLTTGPEGFIASLAEMNMTHAVILAVVCYGIFYSRPAVFDRVSGMKLATFGCLLLVPWYYLLTMGLSCSHGEVAGLTSGNYSRPGCSTQCGCAMPWSEFAPVCVVDTMTTYLTPCHAGCQGTDVIQDLTVLRGCGCAPSTGLQRASLGACGHEGCAAALNTHTVFSVMLMLFTVIVIQVQGVGVFRSVEPRDRRAAFGLSSAVVFFITFGAGHLGYFAIQKNTCGWFEAGRCQLQSIMFPYAVGAISAALGLLAFLINLATWLAMRRQSNNEEKNDDVNTDVAL